MPVAPAASESDHRFAGPGRSEGLSSGLVPGLDWVSQLPSSAAPGFVYLAGACRGVPVGGGGAEMGEAAGRLAGEAAEVLAQLAAPVASDAPGDPAIDALWTGEAAPLRVAATAADARTVGVPAAAIFRGGRAGAERARAAPPASLGLAAGPDREAARLAALMELVERDAAARWWHEGAPPQQLDLGAAAAAAADLAALRRGGSPRRTAFLALASPTGLPVVCALSCDGDGDGRGLAFGFKAAVDAAGAARGALMELLQMEIGLELARLRAARGGPAEGDRGPLARAALAPEGFAAFAALPPAAAGPRIAGSFADVAAHLAARGLPVTVADLPRAGGLAVAKAFAPGLRPLPGPGPVREGTPGGAAPLM